MRENIVYDEWKVEHCRNETGIQTERQERSVVNHERDREWEIRATLIISP
jgi:hypothetical protein